MSSTLAKQEEFLCRVLPTFGDKSVTPIRQAGHPCHFLDAHLDERLLLKRVKALPLLATDLSEAVDTCLSAFSTPDGLREDDFQVPEDAYCNAPDISTAPNVALLRAAWLEDVARNVSCSVLLFPDQPDNLSALRWCSGSHNLETVDPSTSDDFLVQHRFLTFNQYRHAMHTIDMFSLENQEKLLALGAFREYWAVGMFFCPSADWLLRDMDAVMLEETFPWWRNSTPAGEPPVSIVQPRCDSPQSLWSLPDTTTVTRIRKIRRSRRGLATPLTEFYSPGPISTIPPENDSWQDKPERYIQRAWANAVRTDATVIVFDCGNFLRIGIRHRDSQTLFLSPLINTREAGKDSVPYGRLLLGLYFGIVSDGLGRYEAESRTLNKTISPLDVQARRHTPLKQHNSLSKRNPVLRRGQNMTAKQVENLEKLFSRTVLALYVQFDVYNSPTPSILFKPGATREQRYSTREYIAMSISKRLGHGATGDVYQGVLVGRSLPTLIVKLATTRERLRRLRHECVIYEYLRTANVVGVPKMFGFFQDGDRNAGALILSDVGSPVMRRTPDEVISFSDIVKQDLTDALKSLHCAGVLHRDLRLWNVLVDGRGRGSIIDFDRARLTASSAEFAIERNRLERLFQGENMATEAPIGREGMAANIDELIMA